MENLRDLREIFPSLRKSKPLPAVSTLLHAAGAILAITRF
jgi:hypothetical protein